MNLVPPLKVPTRYDLQEPLEQWLSSSQGQGHGQNGGVEISSTECRDDLLRLASLRNTVTERTTTSDNYSSALLALDDYKEYHAALLQFESRNIAGLPTDPTEDTTTTSSSSSSNSRWLSPLQSIYKSAFQTDKSETHTSLVSERACILWNLSALEAYSASVQDSSTKVGLGLAVTHWQAAATIVTQLRLLVERESLLSKTSVDWHPKVCLFWEHTMLVQAQMNTYEMARFGKTRVPHLLLGKLAIATVPILNQSLTLCQDPTLLHLQVEQHYGAHCKAWSLWLSAKAEYHEACTNREKSKWGLELARLKRCLSIHQDCQHFLSTIPNDSSLQRRLEQLHLQSQKQSIELQARLEQATHDNATIYHEIVPKELLEIRGEWLAKSDTSLPPRMVTPQHPFFSNVLTAPAKQALERYHHLTETLVYQASALVEDQKEVTRTTLARANLPHSLTAYKQEQSGGGIPNDLWNRVQALQNQNKMHQLKTNLWELVEMAELARLSSNQASKQLKDDFELDKVFRDTHSNFKGHKATHVQKEVQKAMDEYHQLLQKSQEGDAVLLKRMEILDTDPKYKLLQFQKSQLDKLLPSSRSSSSTSTATTAATADPPLPPPPTATINTSRLSQLLVDLSSSFNQRDQMLQLLKDTVERYDIRDKLAHEHPPSSSQAEEQPYNSIIQTAQDSFRSIVNDIQINVNQESELVDLILVENDRFVQARHLNVAAAGSPANESCIAMIEDGLDDMDFFTKHLKDGQDFYSVMSPKLEQVKQQIGDISVRLAVERFEHEESVDRQQRRTSHPRPALALPGVVPVGHDEPHVQVDDVKVARLVEMGLDLGKAVAALKKYDNNVDLALNELLSC